MRRTLFLVALLCCIAAAGHAADAPQFRGPNRDGIFLDTGLLKAWPPGGPPKAWVVTGIGAGYSSVSVVGDTIYASGMRDGQEGIVSVIDASGKIAKQASYGKETDNKQAPGARSTPTIDGDRLYIMSALGGLTCFQLPALEKLWSVNVTERFRGEGISWDLAESVLIDGNHVICTPGGPNASVVALDKMSGATVWTSKGLSDPASYCSPNIIVHNGHRLLVTETAKLVAGLRPNTGKLLWTHPHETDYDVHGVTPHYADGLLYYSGGYGSGGGALGLSEDGSSVRQRWTDKELDCQHHGVVLVDGYIYGTGHSGHSGLICSRSQDWQPEVEDARRSPRTNRLRGWHALCLRRRQARGGKLGQGNAGSFRMYRFFRGNRGREATLAHPAIANGRLYLRHGDALIAYDIAAK